MSRSNHHGCPTGRRHCGVGCSREELNAVREQRQAPPEMQTCGRCQLPENECSCPIGAPWLATVFGGTMNRIHKIILQELTAATEWKAQKQTAILLAKEQDFLDLEAQGLIESRFSEEYDVTRVRITPAGRDALESSSR